MKWWFLALLLLTPAAAAAGDVTAGAGPAAQGQRAARDQGEPKPHVHAWAKQSRKEWVPPVKKVVQVGVDSKGKPILQTQIVKPGYWKTITWLSCSCGAKRG
jgi:hypothetical protein